MTDLELEQMLADLECDRVERKSSASDRSSIRQAICAFANDMPNHGEPGVLFVGAHDDGTCAQLAIDDELLRMLAGMRSDGNILPIPSMTVQKRIVAGCEMAVIEVKPSDAPPVRYNGRIWIRVGPRRATASADGERQLNERRIARDLPFDLRPVHSATTDDLDLRMFQESYLRNAVASEVLEANERSIVEQLSSLRFLSKANGGAPTVVGLLAIGKDPVSFVSGAYVQFLRIQGTQLSDDIVDQKECHGALLFQLRQLDEILKANIRIATDITSDATEKRQPDYPLAALQQLTRNAVMHRNYETSNAPVRVTWFDDRLEIQNPGGPYGQVTRLNFGQPGITDYRNPNVAEAMRTLGFVQRFGVGIQVANQALAANGNRQAEFHAEDNHVLVTVWNRK